MPSDRDQADIVLWNSEEGRRRLFSSKYIHSFFALAHLFERQIKPTYCGIASAVIVLNALRRDKQGLKLEDKLDVPVPDQDPMRFNYYNQLTFLDRKSQKVKTKASIEGNAYQTSIGAVVNFNPGLALEDLARMLRLHMLEVALHQTPTFHSGGLERFRQDVMADGPSISSFLIANFDGKIFGREGGGHFSPLAGYHPETDSCLVMDTNGCMQPWFWVPVDQFYRSMCTLDGTKNRGYLVVSDRLDKS